MNYVTGLIHLMCGLEAKFTLLASRTTATSLLRVTTLKPGCLNRLNELLSYFRDIIERKISYHT